MGEGAGPTYRALSCAEFSGKDNGGAEGVPVTAQEVFASSATGASDGLEQVKEPLDVQGFFAQQQQSWISLEKPFKSKDTFTHYVYRGFKPVPSELDDGVTDPRQKGMKMECVFNGQTYERSNSSTQLAYMFIGNGVLRKPKITELPDGYKHLQPAFERFVVQLKWNHARKVENKKRAKAEKDAKRKASIEVANEREAKRKAHSGNISKYLAKYNKTLKVNEAMVTDSLLRFWYAQNISFVAVETPLFVEFCRSLLNAGRDGISLPDISETFDPLTHLTLPTRKSLGERHLDEMYKDYQTRIRENDQGRNSTSQRGFCLTSDGTTRYSRAVMNIAIILPTGELLFWSLKDTSGEKKDTWWICQFIVDSVKAQNFPFDVMNLTTIIMDGACRHAFDLIETEFKADPHLPNIVCQWCACHSFSLLLKALDDVHGFNEVITEMKELIKFVRNHDKPNYLLRKHNGTSLIKWVETRFGTVFICMQRLVQNEKFLKRMLLSDEWAVYLDDTKDRADLKVQVDNFSKSVNRITFWNKMKKILQLVKPIFYAMRLSDSDLPTVGVMYQLWLTVVEEIKIWEATKFDPIPDVPDGTAFTEADLVTSKKSHKYTGNFKPDDMQFTIADMAQYRWECIYGINGGGSKRGGWLHSAGRALNPALRDYDISEDVKDEFNAYLHWTLGEELGNEAYSEWEMDYCTLDKDNAVFHSAGGAVKDSCDWDGPSRGTNGAYWWMTMSRDFAKRFKVLRPVAIRVLSATTTESSAERHFSAVADVQRKTRATLSPEKVGKLTFVRQEILSELSAKSASCFDELYTEKGLIEITNDAVESIEYNDAIDAEGNTSDSEI